ncbi:ATP-binding protein [Nocardioides sp.]|uniref:ATP-binding protein n=1 Tax=Nocardioides sp. TaxID=35761 RepID=UPI002D7FABFC|nr:ATP-binding protein [Nocardioides sp.]HET8960704.1 ATP-binding protein [Nocardioides sp.]
MHEARRWAAEACSEIGRGDLSECAELGVSELIGNAILHGERPVRMRVRGTPEHPRIEVSDASPQPPLLPDPSSHHPINDDPLITFGRGLDIVARCSDAWGADIDDQGKVVWFVPATAIRSEGVEGVITGSDRDRPEQTPPDHHVHVEVREVPLRTLHASQTQWSELRREVRLLSLAHEDDYPLAKSLSELFADIDRILREGIHSDSIETALAAGAATTDLRVNVPEASAETIEQFLDLLDLADEFCQKQRLLSLARTPEQRRFQRWLFGEFVRQQRGEPPQPWPDVRETADHAC